MCTARKISSEEEEKNERKTNLRVNRLRDLRCSRVSLVGSATSNKKKRTLIHEHSTWAHDEQHHERTT